jgi:hypothetical protein
METGSFNPAATGEALRPRRRLHYERYLLYFLLAALSVKTLQEVAGVRLASLLGPIIFFAAYSYRPNELRLPSAVKCYALFSCVGLPLLSLIASGKPTFYDAYLVATVTCAIMLLLVAFRKLGFSPLGVARAYANAMTWMCVLSVLTLEHQWFGGYAMRTFSDFAPLFGLQVSVAVPFLSGRHRNLKRLIVLATLFFTFSRTSFIFALLIITFQLSRESRGTFIRGMVVGSLMLAAAALTSDVGSLMLGKMVNVVAVLTNSSTETPEINPSDLGRLAYASVTLESLLEPRALAIGHGIKTNHLIIEQRLDVSDWGLDESMADATVHNVYLEMLSDTGLAGALIFVAFIVYAGVKIVRRHGALSPAALSFFAFALSYMFEANYVTFFFQFFVCFYLWLGSSDAPSVSRRMRIPP